MKRGLFIDLDFIMYFIMVVVVVFFVYVFDGIYFITFYYKKEGQFTTAESSKK